MQNTSNYEIPSVWFRESKEMTGPKGKKNDADNGLTFLDEIQ